MSYSLYPDTSLCVWCVDKDLEREEGTGADGLRLVEHQCRLRFGRDGRMAEVCRLLNTSKPLFLKVCPGVNRWVDGVFM